MPNPAKLYPREDPGPPSELSNSLCALHKLTASDKQSQGLGSFPEKGQITFSVEDQMSLLQRLRSTVEAQQQPRTVKN